MQIVKAEYKPISKIDGNEALLLIQRIAKTCYKSYKDSDDIESAKRIVKALIDSGHHSLLENYIVTMNYVSNIAAYKDLTRSRVGFSYAIESTRWCNYSKGKFGNEIKFLDPVEIPDKNSKLYNLWKQAMQNAENSYMEMAKEGANPDQLSLDLPQSTASEFNITANLRAWRNLFDLRVLDKTGHARDCIHEILDPTLELFHEKIPVVFDDQYELLQKNRAKKKFQELQNLQQLTIPFNEQKTK